MIDLKTINRHWTLFLDRDGVINEERDNDYVSNWQEFRFCLGVEEAISIFSKKFQRILIVTNQRGVGKGLMTEADLEAIHQSMVRILEAKGGRIDKIYYSTELDDTSMNRKPNPGMGWKAKHDFPDLDFARSIMIGNTMGDMQFGRTLGMHTIFIPSTKPMPDLPHPFIDKVFPDLLSVAKAL